MISNMSLLPTLKDKSLLNGLFYWGLHKICSVCFGFDGSNLLLFNSDTSKH